MDGLGHVKNRILVGGSPSTGSSVLVNVLNRHSRIQSGPETYLFIHPKLYQDWGKYKHFIYQKSWFRGLKSIGWFRINGALHFPEQYGFTPSEIQKLVATSPDFQTFSDNFFGLQTHTWLEKSPSNVLAFSDFLDQFLDSEVLLTLRDPYDTIASLYARGMSPVHAVSAYLINTAFGLKSMHHPAFSLLRYEEWIKNPKQMLMPFLQKLELDWEEELLESEGDNPLKMEGWLQDERGKVKTSSIGRFQKLPAAQQDLLKLAAATIQVNPRYAMRYRLKHLSIEAICEAIGYPFQSVSLKKAPFFWKKDLLQDEFLRVIKWYPTTWGQYPVRLV